MNTRLSNLTEEEVAELYRLIAQLRARVKELEDAQRVASFTLNPDTSGGAFTEDEKKRHEEWR